MKHSGLRAPAQLVLLAGMLVACGTSSKVAVVTKAPPPPIEVRNLQVTRAPHYYLVLKPSRAYYGLVLGLRYYDAQGADLGKQEVRFGSAFKGHAIKAGHHRVELLTLDQRTSEVKVSGPKRPVSSIHNTGVPLQRAARVSITTAKRCQLQRYKWQYGMPAPEYIKYVPRPGEEFEKAVCKRPLVDPALVGSARIVRRFDEHRASLKLTLEYNRDFERGVRLIAQLLDKQKRVHGRCVLRVQQGTVYETEKKSYQLELEGGGAGQFLADVVHARVLRFEEGQTGDRRFKNIELRCARRPHVIPTHRRPATIMP